MAILHLLNKPVLTHDASVDCFRSINKGDGLVLIEDGVYLTQRSAVARKNIAIYALQHDLHVRGLSPLQSHIRIIDDAEFVELCTQYDKTISWF